MSTAKLPLVRHGWWPKEVRPKVPSVQSPKIEQPNTKSQAAVLPVWSTYGPVVSHPLETSTSWWSWISLLGGRSPPSVPEQGAATKTLVNHFIVHVGAPLELHTDQECNIEIELFKNICQLFQISETRTVPYHPASNGKVKLFNLMLH